MIFQPGERIVFIGDSITDCGRRDVSAPYGDGYMSLVRAFVTARHPELKLRWVNRGVGGDTVLDLRERWEQDAIGERPDWLSVMIGINDVWRMFDGNPEQAVSADVFEATLRSLLSRAVEVTGCRLILADPYIVQPNRADPWRAESDRYVLVVHQLADEFDAVAVHTQEAFDLVLESSEPSDWADDLIHPDLAGHAVIAQTFLRAIGWTP